MQKKGTKNIISDKKTSYNYNMGDETNCTQNLIVLKLDHLVGSVQLSIGRHFGSVLMMLFQPKLGWSLAGLLGRSVDYGCRASL